MLVRFRACIWAFLLAVPVLPVVQLPLRIYTTADGLPSNAAFCIVPDNRGFLWICTSAGLSRFDGKSFDSFGVAQGLPNRLISDFIETKSGALLAATNRGMARLDPEAPPGSAHQFVSVPTQAGRPSLRVENLFEDARGVVWAGTLGGIYRLDQVNGTYRLTYFTIGNSTVLVQALADDGANGLWIGTNVGLCRRSEGGQVEWFSHGADSPPAASVNALLMDRQSQLWAGTYSGLWLLKHKTQAGVHASFQVYGRKEGLASERIHSLFESSGGTLWVGTASGIAELISGRSAPTRFQSYGTAEGLRGRVVFAVNQSKDGSLWVGVDHGLARIAKSGFLRYTKDGGMGEIGVSAFTRDLSGRLYAVSNELHGPELHRFNGVSFSSIRPAYPAGLAGSGWGLEQVVLTDHAGEWWFATGQGLIRFPAVQADELPHTKARAVYTAKDGLPSSAILRIFEDSRGSIWVSTLGGLVVWSRESGSSKEHAQDGRGIKRPAERSGELLSHLAARSRALCAFRNFSKEEVPGIVSAFAEDRAGDVWIAASVEPGTGQKSRLFRFRQNQIKNVTGAGLPDSWISTLFTDSAGRLWIGSTDNELTHVDHPEAEKVKFDNIGEAQGLSSFGVSAIGEDRWGLIYAATARGVDRIDLANGRIRHYSSADGLPDSPVSAMTTDGDGRLWLATGLGVASYLPALDSADASAPVVIKDVEVNGKSVSTQLLADRLQLEPGENQMRLQFAAPRAADNESLRYEYRLNGPDQSWSQASAERSVNYSNLPPGSYHFQVRSVRAGEAFGVPTTLNFYIRPHIWQRWWFRMLMMSGIVVSALGWHRYDLQRRVEIEQVRARIAADLHDDLGASLTRIVILSEVAQRQTVSGDPQLGRHLEQIATSARGLADGMSDLVWSVNPQRDDIPSLLNRVREFASEVLEPQGIAWSLQTADSVRAMPLAPDRRWHLFLILKEAIHNAARHAHCTQVVMLFDIANGCARVSIADNGCGLSRTTSLDDAGNGLTSMRNRAGELGGELRVESTPGKGVRIEVTFPVRAGLRPNKVAGEA